MRNAKSRISHPSGGWQRLLAIVALLPALAAAAPKPSAARQQATPTPSLDQPAPVGLADKAGPSVAEVGPAPIASPADAIASKPFASRIVAESTAAVAAAPTITGFTASPALPKPWGTMITWTVTATGGVAPLSYQFVRYNYQTVSWSIVKAYSSSNIFTWTPTQVEIGKYVLQVWVKNSGSVANYDAWKGTAPFDILSNAPNVTSFQANVTFPKRYGSAITWTAIASGGIAPLQYRFVRYNYQTLQWSVVKDYTTTNTFTWTPTVSEIGRYALQVWVLNAGSTAAYDAWRGIAAFDIIGPPPTISSLTSMPAAPSPAGVSMAWTAAASGGVAPLQYQFVQYSYTTGTWSVVQSYGTSNTYTWIPSPSQAGQYVLQVWVKNAGSPNVFDAWRGTPFTISPAQPLVAQGMSVLPGLPRPVNTTLVWQANTTGGLAPLQYQFVRYKAATGSWSVVQSWSTNRWFSWTPTAAEAGVYALQVWVKNAGSTSVYDAYGGSGFFSVTPPTSDIVRFLEQAAWGPTDAEIERVRQMGMSAWIDDQINTAPSGYPAFAPVTDDPAVNCTGNCQRDNYSMYPLQRQFFLNALYGQDQLRQRVAWALHSLVVTSGFDLPLPSWSQPYHDAIYRNTFGNYRQLLYEVTLNPAMGEYLNMDTNTLRNPNENYAREVMQLFSVGTGMLNIDGTYQKLADGTVIPTYDQFIVTEFARALTGWHFSPQIGPNITNYRDPMIATTANHDLGSKFLLGGFITAPGVSPQQDLDSVIDNIFNHPNVGPYIARHMIRQLVTSNPSPAYIARIATVFNDNGSGVRGDMKAVVKALLLDPEARQATPSDPNFGHLKEPVLLMTGLLRAMNVRSANGMTQSDGYLAPQASNLGEDSLRPPSVFSYFPADYLVPGMTIGGPEFGIFNSVSVLRRANFVNTMVFSGIPATAATGNAPNGTSIDLSLLTALAGNPDMMLKELDRLLLHDTMSAQMKTILLNAVNAVPASNPLLRAQTALYLVASSSQYQVER